MLTNTTATSLSWSLVNTSAWLKVSVTNGTLTAGAHTNLTCSLLAAASNLTVGTYTANLTFTNVTYPSAIPAVFTLQVSQPMALSATNGFSASGLIGGPFTPTTQTFALSNLSASSIPWSMINTSFWLSATPASGTLAAGAVTTLTVSLAATATNLASGNYTARVQVTNFAGLAASLPFGINVGSLSIVSNGGFETGDFSGWTLNGSSRYNVVTSNSGYTRTGTYGAYLGQTSASPPGYLFQNLTTVPGQKYLLSLWLANPTNTSSATPNQFLVQWNGTTIGNLTNVNYVAWTNLQFIVSATGSSSVLQFGFYDVPYYLGLDDVSVTPFTVPTFNAAKRSLGSFNLTWTATAGVNYQIQYSTNLARTNWINLGQPLLATNSSMTLTDTNALSSSRSRFYRVQVVP